MQHEQWEILILKPTTGFISFLEQRLPDFDMPSLSSMQVDNTAYTFKKQSTEEATLDEVAKHYQNMFQFEITRWVGECEFERIGASFLDFLCCFKFEFHTQIVLMEPSMDDGHQVLCIKPRTVALKWVQPKSTPSDFISVFDNMAVKNFVDDATLLVKNFSRPTEIKPFMQNYYRPIFDAELVRMCDVPEHWPKMNSFKAFNRYFEVDPHSHLVHLH